MQTQFFQLSPVEVVKVTSGNMAEVAEWCGGEVRETESRRVKDRMDKYVYVPTPKGNGIAMAFPGMFITKRLAITQKDETKATFSVFRRDYFDKNYFQSPEEAFDKTWGREGKPNPAPQPTTVINVFTSESENLTEVAGTVKAALIDAGISNEVEVGQAKPRDNFGHLMMSGGPSEI